MSEEERDRYEEVVRGRGEEEEKAERGREEEWQEIRKRGSKARKKAKGGNRIRGSNE